MKTLLLHAATYARMGARLAPFKDQFEIVLLSDDDSFARADTGEAVDVCQPHVCYGNADVWYGPVIQTFMKTLIASPHLDWFQSAAAGVEHPALVMIGRNATHYTTNHKQAEAMSEWALWQALDFLRAGPAHRTNAANGDWKPTPAREIAGSNWLIIGFGSIGAAVGKRVMALGGNVTGLRRTQGLAEGADRIVSPDAMLDELPKADIVLLCAPHTPETESMADAAFFAAMKPDALFMNLGRGALVDEAALLSALDAGRPSFAALDVVREEPLPSSSPIWRHPRIALTPHDSTDTPGSILRADDTFMENLERYLAGQPLMHLVEQSVFHGG